MTPYASRTGTRRNLKALREAGWHLLVSARGVLRSEGFPYALDNGAWTAFQKGEAFDVPAFETAVAKMGDRARWIVLPDIVGGGLPSLEFSMRWAGQLPSLELLAVQDGMEPNHVEGLLGPNRGIFLGGSTEFKLSTMRQWGRVANENGAYFHVGRVNTRKRIRMCKDAGADSFDGTSATRFAVNIPMLTAEVNQMHLFQNIGEVA